MNYNIFVHPEINIRVLLDCIHFLIFIGGPFANSLFALFLAIVLVSFLTVRYPKLTPTTRVLSQMPVVLFQRSEFSFRLF